VSRPLEVIEAERAHAKAHADGLERALVVARGRVAELDAELALADPERCRLVIVGGAGGRGNVRVITTECELWEAMTGLRCVEPCSRHRPIAAEPLHLIRIPELQGQHGDAS